MDATTHEGTVILTEACAYRVLFWEHYALEKQRQQGRKLVENADAQPMVSYKGDNEGHYARECPTQQRSHWRTPPPHRSRNSRTWHLGDGACKSRSLLPEHN